MPNPTITVAALNAMIRDRARVIALSSNDRIRAADSPVSVGSFVAPVPGIVLISAMFRAFPAKGIPILTPDKWTAVLMVDGAVIVSLAVDPKTLLPYKALAFVLPSDMAAIPANSIVEAGLTTDGAPVALDCPSFTLTFLDA